MTSAEIPLHDLSQRDKESTAFRLIPLEYNTNYDTSVPHRHDYYEIFLFREGGGWHDLDFEKIPINRHSLHFVSPGQVHEVRRVADSSGYVMLFSREIFHWPSGGNDFLFDHPLLNNNNSKPCLDLNEDEWNRISLLVEHMAEDCKVKTRQKEELIKVRLHLLLVEAKGMFETRERIPVDKGDGLFRAFRVLLEKKFREFHLVKNYAQELGKGEKQLNEAVKRMRGKTALNMVHERIILEAKRMLLHSDMSAKEIAHFLGFDDPSHFSKFFRGKVDRSPSSFREWVRTQHQDE